MQPSKMTLRPIKGATSDITPADMPEGFALDSINGRFMPSEDGLSFQWTGVHGEIEIPITGNWVSSYQVLNMLDFDGFIVSFVWDSTGSTYIYRFNPIYGSNKSIASFTAVQLVYDEDNLFLNISAVLPIQKVRIVRDTNEIFTVYWTDVNGVLKSIRIIDNNGNDSLSNVSFSQPVTYGTIDFLGFGAGSLPGGSMFYAYRLLGENGSVTDWSMAMGPILIPNKPMDQSPTFDKYTRLKYAKKGELSSCCVNLQITGIDVNFDKIQIVAMVSAENGTFEKGYICHQEDIANRSTIPFSHVSEKNFGTILPEEVQISTQTILGCTDFELVNNIMIILGPKVDNALVNADPSDKIQFNKVVDGTVTANTKQISFDENDYTTTPPAYTDPILGVSAPQEVHSISKYKNQSTQVNVTSSLTVPAGYTGYKHPIRETLMRTCWRGETYRVGMVPVNKYGKRLGVRWIDDITIPARDVAGLSSLNIIDDVNGKRKANVINALVGGIDISQWVHGAQGSETCDIQGFHIVVAPREKRVLNEGALFCAAAHDKVGGTEVMEDYGVISGNRRNDDDVNLSDYTPQIISKLYQYYSPDVQNDLLVKPAGGVRMKIEAQQMGDFTTDAPNTLESLNFKVTYKGGRDSFMSSCYDAGYVKPGLRIWNKYFHKMDTSDTPAWAKAHNPALHDECDVLGYYDLEAFNGAFDHDLQAIYIDELARRKFINAYWGQIDNGIQGAKNAFGGGAACRLMVLDDTLLATAENPFATAFTDGITIASVLSGASNLYGGQSNSALAVTQYRSCWHYQPINQTVLGHIRTAQGKYIFDNVEVFIGDSFIVPFSLNRLFHCINNGRPDIPDIDQEGDPYPSMSFVVPIQSNINATMHMGDSWEKNRSYRYYNNNAGGIKYSTGIGIMKFVGEASYGMLEKIELPQFANVVYGQNLYFALPESIFYTDQYPMQVFWSRRRVNSGETDNFRVFPFENNLVVPGDFGLPTAIRSLGETAIIFTDNGIGAIPVDERSAIQDSSGKSLSLARNEGIGKFEIVDRTYALQHINSLSQNGDDFTWFDFKNRDWIYWPKGQRPTALSEKFNFKVAFNDLLQNSSILDETIYTAFLTNKEIAIYRPNADEAKNRAYVFDYLNNLYHGRRDIKLGASIYFNSIPITIVSGKMNSPGLGIQNYAYGKIVSTELHLSANIDRNSYKIFDSFRLTGQNISYLELTSQDGSSETSICRILDENGNVLKYPQIDTQGNLFVGPVAWTRKYDYLRGFYAVVKVKGISTKAGVPILFDSLVLNVRKDILP